jgi:DNA-binding NtrC family response regulator
MLAAIRIIPQGAGTILLVEDDEVVRRHARIILQMNGYSVLTASKESEALFLCLRYEGSIDLIITDIAISDECGPELFEQLLRLRPEMKVLFKSDYADNAVAHHGRSRPGASFIQKPFTPDILVSKVRQVLNE